MTWKFKFIFILITAGTISCGRISNEELAEQWWKYGSGYSVGDVLIFTTESSDKSKCFVSGDTIYSQRQTAIAIITGTETKPDGQINLYLRDPITNESGTYHGKGNK